MFGAVMSSAQIDIAQIHTWGDLFKQILGVLQSPSELMFFLMNVSGIYSSHTTNKIKK